MRGVRLWHGLLTEPGAGGAGGDPGGVHPVAAVLDHGQEVEAAPEDGVDMGEVDGEERQGKLPPAARQAMR